MTRRSPLPFLALLLAGCAVTGPVVTPPPPRVDRGAGMEEARLLARTDPREPYWPFHMAERYVAADSAAVAETWLGEALARDPDYAPALSLRSRLLYEQGRHQEAREMLEAARSRTGAAFPGSLLAGLALHYEAMGEMDRVAALLPTLDAASRAYLHLRRADDRQALEASRLAVRQAPESAVNHNNLGLGLLLAGDVDGAKASFEAAAELDPTLPGPYYNLAILERFYLVRDAEAAAWLARYRALSQEDPDGLFEALPGSLAGGNGR